MALELLSLTQQFGQHVALDDVSIRLEPGQVYGLIGHNGAGKTTALRIALGLASPRSGQVIIDGFSAARFQREARVRIGGLIESPGFHPTWDGEANLWLLARLQGLSRVEAREEVDRTLELVGLTGLSGRAVRAYSHGMRQRLGIAQALLGRPRYVLLDEPTDGLDPEGIADMRRLITHMAVEEGTAVLVSSHQLLQLTGLCNRVGLMRRGRLLADEPLQNLLHGAADRYVLRTGDDGAAAAVLRGDGVRCEALPQGGLSVDLSGQAPGDVARGLVERGHELRAFAPRERTLEEVYLELCAAPEAEQKDRARAAAVAESATVEAKPVDAKPVEHLAPPGPVLAVLRHEFTRWVRSPGTWILMLFPGVIAGIQVAARYLEAEGFAAEVREGVLASTTTVTAFEGVAVALRGGLPVLLIAILGVVSQTIAGELGRGTLRHVLLRPVTRPQLALGKALAGLMLAGAGYLWLLAVGLVSASLAFDFGDLTEVLPNGKLFPFLSAEELWPPLWSALASPLVPLSAYVGIGFLISAAASGPVLALALSVVTYVALDWGRGFARALDRALDPGLQVESCLPSAYYPSPFGDTSYIEYYYRFALGESNITYRYGSTELIVPLCWGLAAFALAVVILRKRKVP